VLVLVGGGCRMTPLRVRMQSMKMRLGLCSEELCFNHPALGTFFALGNGVPIQRGGSIHQKVRRADATAITQPASAPCRC
jgi:hypothetical protein